MIKIGVDGSGAGTMITGCPNCDEFSHYLRYIYCGWVFDIDDGREQIPIKYCPSCGIELPALEGWKIIKTAVKH